MSIFFKGTFVFKIFRQPFFKSITWSSAVSAVTLGQLARKDLAKTIGSLRN